MNIGFIGFGNMAQALADGLLFTEAAEPRQIFACAKNWDKLLSTAGARGVNPCRTAAEVAEKSDLVVVAVKPYLVEEVLAPVGELLRGNLAGRDPSSDGHAEYAGVCRRGNHSL